MDIDLWSVVGVIAFVVALLTSVMIHEAGHYLTAKRFGMKVTEFFLGFGARICRFVAVRPSSASKRSLPVAIARSSAWRLAKRLLLRITIAAS